MDKSNFGIYVNIKALTVVRINSPYWVPQSPDWIFLTPEVNMPLIRIRDLARTKNVCSQADAIDWA